MDFSSNTNDLRQISMATIDLCVRHGIMLKRWGVKRLSSPLYIQLKEEINMTTANTGTTKRKTSRGKKGNASPSLAKAVGSKMAEAKEEEQAACLSMEEREQCIASAAYCRAEQRNFENGTALDDWLAAESDINARYPKEMLEE